MKIFTGLKWMHFANSTGLKCLWGCSECGRVCSKVISEMYCSDFLAMWTS